jgi:hypothetical protein
MEEMIRTLERTVCDLFRVIRQFRQLHEVTQDRDDSDVVRAGDERQSTPKQSKTRRPGLVFIQCALPTHGTGPRTKLETEIFCYLLYCRISQFADLSTKPVSDALNQLGGGEIRPTGTMTHFGGLTLSPLMFLSNLKTARKGMRSARPCNTAPRSSAAALRVICGMPTLCM